MDLRRLRHLVALAEWRNFSRAAEHCNLTQSAFSRSIQAAEEELGLRLFDRGTGEATPTDAGRFVLERAHKLLFEARCLVRDVGQYRERLMGDLALGVGPYPAATLLGPLLTTIRQQYPAVQVRVEVNNADTLAGQLRSERLDFYVADLRNIEAAPDLNCIRFTTIPARFYVRRGHPLLQSSSVTITALLAYGIGSVRVPQVLRQSLGQVAGLPSGTPVPLALECDDLHLLQALALSTDTVIVCPDAFVQGDASSAALVPVPIAALAPLYADLAIVTLQGRSWSPMTEWAIASIQRLATPG